jgi:PTS system glucitol/sorbitol-specific IIC component
MRRGENFMNAIASVAQGFIGLFTAGGETFTGWVTGIIPQVVCLLTFMNSIIKLVGEEKVEKFAKKLTSNMILRYSLFPLIADIFLGNPMQYSFGRFVEEKYKPAFYDASVSFCHPITGLFPHANAGELFVFMGIAEGVKKVAGSYSDLAVRYFIVGLIVITIRGIVTEKIYFRLAGINKK